MAGEITYEWRGRLTDAEMVELVQSHGGRVVVGWWRQVREHSLGWVTARTHDGELVGFVNVAWDGRDHAFLLDTKARGDHQRLGIGTAVVRRAAEEAKAAGCEWLHVDFEAGLDPFYYDACAFRPTRGGLIHLPSQRLTPAASRSGQAAPWHCLYFFGPTSLTGAVNRTWPLTCRSRSRQLSMFSTVSGWRVPWMCHIGRGIRQCSSPARSIVGLGEIEGGNRSEGHSDAAEHSRLSRSRSLPLLVGQFFDHTTAATEELGRPVRTVDLAAKRLRRRT